KQWKNGMMHMNASWPSRRAGNHDAPWIAFDTMLWCDNMAPLDSPVVPPVYTSPARSVRASTLAGGDAGYDPDIISFHHRTLASAGTGGQGSPASRADFFSCLGTKRLMGN